MERIPSDQIAESLRAAALSNLAAVPVAPVGRKEADQSIRHVLHAIDAVVGNAAPEAVEARSRLGELLRALELLSLQTH